MPGTSEYTVAPEPPPPPPEPEVRATVVEPEAWVSGSGWTTMAKRATKAGYTVKLTYARGRFAVDSDLTHGIMLYVYDDKGRVATAWWWAKADPDDTDNLRPVRKYQFKGAIIAGQPWKVSSTELTAFLTTEEDE